MRRSAQQHSDRDRKCGRRNACQVPDPTEAATVWERVIVSHSGRDQPTIPRNQKVVQRPSTPQRPYSSPENAHRTDLSVRTSSLQHSSPTTSFPLRVESPKSQIRTSNRPPFHLPTSSIPSDTASDKMDSRPNQSSPLSPAATTRPILIPQSTAAQEDKSKTQAKSRSRPPTPNLSLAALPKYHPAVSCHFRTAEIIILQCIYRIPAR